MSAMKPTIDLYVEVQVMVSGCSLNFLDSLNNFLINF